MAAAWMGKYGEIYIIQYILQMYYIIHEYREAACCLIGYVSIVDLWMGWPNSKFGAGPATVPNLNWANGRWPAARREQRLKGGMRGGVTKRME